MGRRTAICGLLMGMLLGGLACEEDEQKSARPTPLSETDPQGVPARAKEAIEIARALQNAPEGPEAVLRSHDMTIEQFEAKMYEVAASPELSEAFMKAMDEKP
jgi:hypothetical protein